MEHDIRTPSWGNTKEIIRETHIANGRRKIFFPLSTNQLNPHPNFNVGCLMGHGFFVTRRRLPLGHNIEIRGKGCGTTWEEYVASTVPGGPSFPQTKHLRFTDMRACLTDGPLLRSPQKSSGGRAMVVHGKNVLRRRYPGGRRFPRQRAGSARPARPGRPGGQR